MVYLHEIKVVETFFSKNMVHLHKLKAVENCICNLEYCPISNVWCLRYLKLWISFTCTWKSNIGLFMIIGCDIICLYLSNLWPLWPLWPNQLPPQPHPSHTSYTYYTPTPLSSTLTTTLPPLTLTTPLSPGFFISYMNDVTIIFYVILNWLSYRMFRFG